MADETKKSESSTDTKEEETKTEKKEESQTEENTNWQKEVEAYKAKLSEANKKLEDRDAALSRIQKARYAKKDEEEKEEESEPVDVASVVKQEVAKARKEMVADKMEEILSRLTDDPHEREMIRLKYQNEVMPSGFSASAIEEDLKVAYFKANQKRLESQIFQKAKEKVEKEIAEKKSQSYSSAGYGNSGKTPPQTDPNAQMSERDRSWLDSMSPAARDALNKLNK